MLSWQLNLIIGLIWKIIVFDCLPNINKNKIKLLHAIIWLSLTSYAWEDYDSICGAFYNGIAKLGEVL